jgi:hypothetical protein
MSESYNEKWRSFISKDEEAFDSSLLFEELEKEINKFDKLISEMSKIDLSTPDQTEDRSLLTEEKRTLTFSDLPDVPISEIGWSSLSTTEEGKEIPSQQRQQLAQFLNNIQGNSLQEKLKSLSDFYKMDDTFKQKLSAASSSSKAIAEAISYLTFFKTLTQVITNFNASAAGFTFESFLAVLLGGSQIATGGGTIADFKTGAGEPVSLKLYKEGNLEVAGSYRDLVNDLLRDGKMRYICVTKNLSGAPGAQEGNLKFYSFSFTLENLFNVFGNSNQKDSSDCMLLPASFMATGGKNIDALNLTKKKQFPSTEEIDKMFVDNFKEALKSNKEIQPTDEEIEELLRWIDFANNDAIFLGTKERGKAQFRKDTEKNAINKGEIYGSMMSIADKVNTDLVNSLKASMGRGEKEKAEINKEYFGGDKKIRVKKSQEFYQKANDELKKKCLQVSFGYVSNKQFKLSEKMIKNIVNLSQPTTKGVLPEGQSQVDIGAIEIGATKISEVLEQISKVLNENIFDIFNNLKALTINIQSYFAGGLEDDARATAAQKNADNIEKKTGELKDRK